MKLSKLTLSLALTLFFFPSLSSQSSSTHVVSIDNDDESVHIEYEEGKITLFQLNGETIDKIDYPNYQHIFDKYKNMHESPSGKMKSSREKNDIQSKLHINLKRFLSNRAGMDDSKYEFKLTSKYIKLNGENLDSKILAGCLDIFKETAGYSLSKGSYFHVDISPKSRSISLSIND